MNKLNKEPSLRVFVRYIFGIGTAFLIAGCLGTTAVILVVAVIERIF